MAPATSESASPIGIANVRMLPSSTFAALFIPANIAPRKLPNQRHKIVAKRGAAFTIMVAGESGLGKTTFINTLFSTTIKNYADHRRRHAKQVDKTVEIEITKAELEEKFFKVRLTVIDTPGFGDYVNNRDSWMPIIEFLDDQHESYMLQEQQPRRVDKIDLRVHACLYFIRPTGHTLKPLDIEVMKRLSSRVNLIPVIAKADTLSPTDLARFKHRIRNVIEMQGIKIYQPPLEEDDEAAANHARALLEAMPFAVIGSEKDVKTQDGRVLKGRQYSWGVAEVEDEDHCDFKKLRSILIRTHMLDLIHTTEEMHYEAYRAQQMETRKFGEARPKKLDNPKFKEEEEALRKRFTEQVKLEENRFRQWEQKLIAERDRLNKDLETTHAAIKNLEMELEQMQGSVQRSHGRHLAVGADNARFASVGGDKQVFLWDVSTARTLRRWAGHFSRVNCVDFGGDEGSVVVSGSFDATVRIWDAKSQSTKPVQVLEQAKDSVSALQVSGWEIVTGCVDGKVRVYDLRMGIVSMADAIVLSGSEDGQVCVWDVLEGKLLGKVDAHRGKVASAVAWNRTRKEWASAGIDDG
ncbi:Septin spn4 [Bacidia gigantensis]|uniref:Septin spn4 n=1 Tax=Bacidia gigantensis TaxID=2732470 RepID=UPI001D0490BF|nr:Septin spn4 [Bacidia gigantensis]KAG8529815.1 Septin spn4 [Bacidia gigantensis]